MSKRRQKSLDAAEECCRAFRKAVSYAATQEYYMRVALDWLIVWRNTAPKKVWTADPIIPKKRR